MIGERLEEEVRGRAENGIVRTVMTCAVQQSKKGWVAPESAVHQRNKKTLQRFDKKFLREEPS